MNKPAVFDSRTAHAQISQQQSDCSGQYYQDTDEKDFEIRTIREERLIDPAPGLDDEIEFAESMYNYGEADNLPDSDKAMECEPHRHCVHKGK